MLAVTMTLQIPYQVMLDTLAIAPEGAAEDAPRVVAATLRQY